MTVKEREEKIKKLQELKDKTTDKKEKWKIQRRISDYKNWERKLETNRKIAKKKRAERLEQKHKSIAILKSRTALELAYIKYTKEDNKKFFETNNYKKERKEYV